MEEGDDGVFERGAVAGVDGGREASISDYGFTDVGDARAEATTFCKCS
jgi:hypothetical protein